ncbi:MAG: energy-coupling factor transporter ATPase [Lachnospiraceae bacterium]|nr:energy-coupling factor transporter ATPase [Lachnospiraceae bacterium]
MSLILDHVSHIYNAGTTFEKKALDDVSLVIPDGEFIGLIGHTGSGKSTLIQHLNGLLKPTSGTIYFNGQNIYDNDFKLKDLRREVGLVFQYPEYQLFEVSVSKDVLFGPNNLGMKTLDAEMAAYGALKSVGIDESLLDVSPLDLSGGQKRRVAIAGVLAMKPKVLILDEPAAGLDPLGRKEILDLISNIRKEQNITVILVSHSMEDVAQYVERIIVMNRGRIAMDDTPEEVFSRDEELQSMGLDIPEITRLFLRMRKEGMDVPKNVFTVEQGYEAIMKMRGKGKA